MTDTEIIQFITPHQIVESDIGPHSIRAFQQLLTNTHATAQTLERRTNDVHVLEVELDLIDKTLCPRINRLMQTVLHEERLQQGHAFRANEQNLRVLKPRYATLKRGTDAHIKRALQNENPPTITRGEIRTILESFSQYQPDSLLFTDKSTFEFVFEHCTMSNPNDGEPIKLPTMVVRINPSQAKLHLLPYDDAKAFRGYDDNLVVHPHIINSEGAPCWGDFAGPVSQAMHSADLTTLLFILLEFLNAVNPDDSAGIYWPHWIGEDVDEYDEEPDDETAD